MLDKICIITGFRKLNEEEFNKIQCETVLIIVLIDLTLFCVFFKVGKNSEIFSNFISSFYFLNFHQSYHYHHKNFMFAYPLLKFKIYIIFKHNFTDHVQAPLHESSIGKMNKEEKK